MSINSDEQRNIERAVAVARGMLAGEIDLIRGCKQLNDLRWDLDDDGLDERFDPFVVFEGELPLLPPPESRHLWNPDHLSSIEARASSLAEEWRSAILSACRRLLRLYGRRA